MRGGGCLQEIGGLRKEKGGIIYKVGKVDLSDFFLYHAVMDGIGLVQGLLLKRKQKRQSDVLITMLWGRP